ncbi:TetR/AcrR family transcriptional regulator [Streptomyces sp. DSM 44917]|uniref:TetR/AcrR family transcriptional regulator n=1 Tax=Streptomyces boetiae TaxID=3075541 RepID=A0ABU2L4I9_9ACTN|nr:TetR/AcrR family transcriptional regulator [Streptomyces sp. DSM 44917]MDT0306238.1 TetR/AcrR family transcriptional regulator [Streptomyces sp. DSM 44917]
MPLHQPPGAERAAPRTPRGRRAPRPSGDDRQLAILATAERLLEGRQFHTISIDELARGAGISRPTFYFYFASKEAVLLALLDRVAEEAGRAAGEALLGLAEDPPARWRGALAAFYDIFRAHRAVVLAVVEAGASAGGAEVRGLWASVLGGWIAHTARAIEAERERGAAPPGPPAHELAAALNSMNERVFYSSFADDGLVPRGTDVVEVTLHVWLTAIYGTAGS